MRDLTRTLDSWSQCCIVCDFRGNPINPGRSHLTRDCPDRLYRTAQTWAPFFLARLQRLALADTQSCPVCLVPRLICNRWKQGKQGKQKKWVEAGSECWYSGVVILTIVTALEEAAKIRRELDMWMDSWLHSRNLDMVCQWMSARTTGNYLCTLRVIDVFQLVSSAWARLNSTSEGYHCPRTSWTTSTGAGLRCRKQSGRACVCFTKAETTASEGVTCQWKHIVVPLALAAEEFIANEACGATNSSRLCSTFPANGQ